MSSSSGSEAIERAVRFLSAPAVVANPNTDEKIHYLLTKGLSEEEVRLVMQLVEGKTKEAAPRPTRKEEAGGADMVVLLGGSQNSGNASVVGDNTDDSSGEEQSVEAAGQTVPPTERRSADSSPAVVSSMTDLVSASSMRLRPGPSSELAAPFRKRMGRDQTRSKRVSTRSSATISLQRSTP